MKYIFTIAFCGILFLASAQFTKPTLQAYVSPALTTVRLSNDSLVPPKRRDVNRIGDVASYAIQLAVPLKNNRFTLIGGVGFSQRHYSLNKYSFDDFFIGLFLFDNPNRSDTFNLSYVRFTNSYFQVPIAGTYTITKAKNNFQLSVGLSLRSDFLLTSHAKIIFDSSYKIPQPADIGGAQKEYTNNASKFVFTAAPYIETSFHINEKLGLLSTLNLPSYFSTRIDNHLTKSNVELIGFTFGAFYSLK